MHHRWLTIALLVSSLAGCRAEIGDPGGGDGNAGDPAAGDPGAGDPTAGDPVAGDPAAGDPAAGDPAVGDPAAGDPAAGDPGGPVHDALPVPFDEGVVFSTTLYVAEGGSDTPTAGSQGTPFATIGYALSRAGAGTLILVADGNYPPIGSHSPQGQPGAPIKVQGSGGAVIDCAGGAMGGAFSDPAYVVLEGITIQNAQPHGLNIDDGGSYATPGHHLILRNLTIAGAGNGCNCDCIKMSGIDDFMVLASDVSGCNQGEIIDMVGCHRGFISGNFFHAPMANGVQTKGGSADVLIHGNRFSDIPQRSVNAGGSTGAAYYRPQDTAYEGARIQIVANVFERSGNAPVAFVGCDTCVFANNTVIDPRGYVARILEENLTLGPGHSGYFVNNLVVLNSAAMNGYSYVNVGANTEPSTYTFGWNLWYALDNAGFTGPVYQGGVPAEQSGVIQADPELDNLAGGDYQISATSPAIGAGRAVPRGVPADFNRRAYADPPELGAFAAP